ncbi:MAG TPA: alpha/beta family hydrolase [Terriglobales bacterium]|nr:alpha/beta family hydrolase [Terriglobales bacterium]
MTATPEWFSSSHADPPVRGFLHRPDSPSGDGMVLTHGAGGNAKMGLLVALAEAFAGAGFTVLRCDLPFRQVRPFGPPRPNEAARDRAGLANAVNAMRKIVSGRVFLGGQSYGGRQASLLLADDDKTFTTEGTELHRGTATEGSKAAKSYPLPGIPVNGLLLLSYPLHPPAHPEKPRTQHLPNLRAPTLFVQGTKDPFGTIEEIESARKLIPAKTDLLPVEGAGHDLGFAGKKRREELPGSVLAKFREFFGVGS